MAQTFSNTVVVENKKPATEEVRVVQLHEWKEAAACLADAFKEDEIAGYFVNTPDQASLSAEDKWNLHVNILEYLTTAHILRGEVTTIGPDFGCVALWMPPGTHMDDYLTLFRSGLWRLYYKLSSEARTRFFTEFFPLLHETKHAVLGDREEDSYYLVYVGTRKSAQGKGYCRKIIEHTTKKADAEGRACYLESSNIVNIKVYEKFGFKLNRRITVNRAEKPVAMDIMVREPVKPTVSETSQLKGGTTTLAAASAAL